MVKYILILAILICYWNCESNPKPDLVIKAPIIKESTIISDSIFYSYNEDKIDSIWRQYDFDSIVAVILDGSQEIMYDVSKMDKMYAPSSRRKLKETQLKYIIENLSGRVASSYAPADCFEPYHGFFFYKKGKIKARLAICFSCRTYFSKPQNSGGINYKLTKQLFKELGLPIYNWEDSTEMHNSKIKYSDYFK